MGGNDHNQPQFDAANDHQNFMNTTPEISSYMHSPAFDSVPHQGPSSILQFDTPHDSPNSGPASANPPAIFRLPEVANDSGADALESVGITGTSFFHTPPGGIFMGWSDADLNTVYLDALFTLAGPIAIKARRRADVEPLDTKKRYPCSLCEKDFSRRFNLKCM